MKKLDKFLKILMMVLPSILFFSYKPIAEFGETDSMHLELSLPLLWLVLITICTLPLLPQIFRHTPKKLLFALAIIPCYTIFSLLWSSNPLRTFLSAGVLVCLAATILALAHLCRTAPDFKQFKQNTINLFLATSVAVSVFAWLQCILDIAGVSQSATLLCDGCTYHAFGFPHPNAFAIEPQFFGNLLLAPVFLCYYSLLCNKSRKKSNKILLWVVAVFLTTTLFFTFSRGAIYAFLAASAVLILYHLIKKHQKYLTLIPVILCSAIISLLCQGLFAHLSPTNDTFASGITKSINHLTLGKIDFRQENMQPFASETVPRISYEKSDASDTRDGGLARAGLSGETADIFFMENTEISSGQPGARDGESSKFDGYVEESTEVRLTLTEMTLNTWSKNPETILLGTALGGAGPVLYANFPSLGTAKQIVQNEYASLLLEFGLVGVAAVIITAIIIIKTAKLPDKSQKSWLFTLLLAYALTLFFFSGLPNALHIYLLPAFAVLFSKHQFLVHGVVQNHNH